MDKKTKELFDFLYNNMLLDKERNLSNYIDDSNKLKNFEITQSNEEFDIIVRLFEKDDLFITDVAIIFGDRVLQKLFYNETSNLSVCELEYVRLINLTKNTKIDEILNLSKKN